MAKQKPLTLEDLKEASKALVTKEQMELKEFLDDELDHKAKVAEQELSLIRNGGK